jgi:hypothetical protein
VPELRIELGAGVAGAADRPDRSRGAAMVEPVTRPRKVDPLTVRCRKCGARRGTACIRQGGYGTGQPLRRAHPERYATARELAEEAERRLEARRARLYG